MTDTDIPIYPVEGKQVTRDEVRILVAKKRLMQRVRNLFHPFRQIE